MIKLIAILAVVLCAWHVKAGASNSLADCMAVAGVFNNTCPSANTAYSTVASGSGLEVKCPPTMGNCQTGTLTGGQCVFTHKLCITCAVVAGVTRIRVQSNGKPNRCVLGQVDDQTIDFTVNFNQDVYYNSSYIQQTPQSKTAVETLLCTLNTQTTAKPAFVNYVANNGFSAMSEMTGLSTDGAMILKPPSGDNQDPFYPQPPLTAPLTDICLTHTSFYHYHSPSGCMRVAPVGSVGVCNAANGCSSDFKTWMLDYGWTNALKVKTVVGIAMDGHPIYSPWNADGTKITGGYDVCNGMFLDNIGNYGYVAVDTFPYVPTCFGPANYPCARPTCTTNPIATSFSRSSFMTPGACDGTGNSASMLTVSAGVVMAVLLAVMALQPF